jgi:hypothetical protein
VPVRGVLEPDVRRRHRADEDHVLGAEPVAQLDGALDVTADEVEPVALGDALGEVDAAVDLVGGERERADLDGGAVEVGRQRVGEAVAGEREHQPRAQPRGGLAAVGRGRVVQRLAGEVGRVRVPDPQAIELGDGAQHPGGVEVEAGEGAEHRGGGSRADDRRAGVAHRGVAHLGRHAEQADLGVVAVEARVGEQRLDRRCDGGRVGAGRVDDDLALGAEHDRLGGGPQQLRPREDLVGEHGDDGAAGRPGAGDRGIEVQRGFHVREIDGSRRELRPDRTPAMTEEGTRRHAIAVIPGDGIGREVTPAALEVLEAAGRANGFELRLTEHPRGCDHYVETGSMMPADALDTLRASDAILLGAVGRPDVPDHVSLWGLLIPIRRAFRQYVSLRPVRLWPGIPSPLRDVAPADVDMVIVRENNEGEYSEIGGRLHQGTDDELAVQEAVFTRRGTDRVMEYACESRC